VAPALEVRGLSCDYGAFKALSDLDLSLEGGECMALLGHNGSGKTTAIRAIAGLLEPSTGTVRVDGAPVFGEPEAAGARAALAVVPDSPVLYDDLTVGEHVELVAIAHGVAGPGLEQRLGGVLDRLGISGRRDSPPGALSRGMRQKLQLACALIRPHRVLLLDEPVVGLDPASQRDLEDVLLDEKRTGVAVMFSSHQLDFARGVADRAVVLAEGRLVTEGPYEDIIDGGLAQGLGL
jgi:ABC-2 type transport system ATP-binding protein